MSDLFSPKNQTSIHLKSKLSSKKVLNDANKHITNLLNSFINEYEQQGGTIAITKTIRRMQTALKRQQAPKPQPFLPTPKDKPQQNQTPFNPTEPFISSGSDTLRSSLHLVEENNKTEHDAKYQQQYTHNHVITNINSTTFAKYSLSKKNSSSSSEHKAKYTDNVNDKHEYDSSSNSSSNSNNNKRKNKSYSKYSHNVKRGKRNRKVSINDKIRKLTTMKPQQINPNLLYLKRKQTMKGNNVIELDNINYLTHSNMVKLRNICDEIKLNICNDSFKQKLKNTESKIYSKENNFELNNDKNINNKNSNNNINTVNNNYISNTNNMNTKLQLAEHSRTLMLKDQVYDSLDDEEIEDEIYDNFYISTNSTFVFVLDMLIYFLTIYSIIYTPLELALHVRSISSKQIIIFFYIEVIIDIIFCIDVFLRFCISYITFDELEITKLKFIAINYIFSWFLIDLLSAIPFNSMLLYKQMIFERSFHKFYTYKSYVKNLLHFCRLLRLFKSLRFVKANTFAIYIRSTLSKFTHFQRWYKLYVCLVGFILSLHMLISINIFISRTTYTGWLSYYLPNNRNESFSITYVFSLYYILCTLLSIGYGDVVSQSMNERIFNLFLMFFGIMIYSFGISSISTYIMTKDAKTIEFEQKCSVLKEIKLTHEKMSDELYEKIYRFLYYRKKHEKKDKNVILEALPIGLKNNLIYEMYKPIIQHFIFFRNFDNVEFIVKVITCFQVFPCIKGEILVKEGDYLEEMFFVKNGNLSLQLPLPDVDKEIAKTSMSNSTTNINAQKRLLYKKSSMMLAKPLLRQRASLYTLQNRVSYEDMIHDDILTKSFQKEENDDDKYNNIYIQILEIRKNEHFGDILMFLNLRSPLTVKVKSKKAELLLFKKTDAVSISVNYPQIWGRIIRKSLFNMEQIERLINRATKLFLDSNKTKIRKVMKNAALKGVSRSNTKRRIKNINTFQSGSVLLKGSGMEMTSCVNNKSRISVFPKDSSQNNRRFSDIYRIANINTSNIELKSIPSLSVTNSNYYGKEIQNTLSDNSNSNSDNDYDNNSNNDNGNGKNKIEQSYEIKERNENDNNNNSSQNISMINSQIIRKIVTRNLNNIPKDKEDSDIIINTNSQSDSDKTQQEQNSLSNIILTTNTNNNHTVNSPHSTESIDINCGIHNISIHSQNMSLVSYYSFSSKNIHSCHTNSFTLPAQYANILSLYQNELTKAKQIVDALIQCGTNAYNTVYNSLSQIALQFEMSFMNNDDKKSNFTGKLSRNSTATMYLRANSLNNVINQKRITAKNFLNKKDSLFKRNECNKPFQKSQSVVSKMNKQQNGHIQGGGGQRKEDIYKNGLLTEIRENVEEDAFNLNNPEMFYAEYFQKIMDKEHQQIFSGNNVKENNNG